MNIKSDLITEEIYGLFNQGDLNLNLGCGDLKLEKCLNCDLYNENADKKLDARDLSEFPNGRINAIYAGELLEHLEYEEVQKALVEWHRALREGGHLIIHVPDMEALINMASDWICSKWQSVRIMSSSPGEVQGDTDENIWFNIWVSLMNQIYGEQSEPGQYHKWGYCAKYLARLLTEAGFKINKIYRGYPKRPTPTLMVIAEKNGPVEQW
jgi:predicted SAM-dependent methyltransferase